MGFYSFPAIKVLNIIGTFPPCNTHYRVYERAYITKTRTLNLFGYFYFMLDPWFSFFSFIFSEINYFLVSHFIPLSEYLKLATY